MKRAPAPRSEATFTIDALLTPTAFSHRVERLQLIETHVSWLVLTGPFVYKIKKPVHYDFLDASTLERRRHLCHEELRLNRRLAPQLYVDVVTIAAGEAGLRIGGAGPPLEYAVRLRQFAADAELHSLIASDRVTVAEIAALGELLGRFHAIAPVALWRQRGIRTNRLLDAVLVNSGDLVAQLQEVAPELFIGPLSDWLSERIERDQALFEQRERWGYIRECHGDLHVGNIVRYDARLLPFDCLEFDPDLRWIDVIDDVAFLTMDLIAHERSDLAFALLSRYLESNGDYCGLRLLPFYAVHRALVRAKVDALSMTSVPARTDKFRSRLLGRLRCAMYWTQPRRPTLVLMHGLSGSGKSWLSERLVPELHAVRIRSDVERKRMAGVAAEAAHTPNRASLYAAEFTHRTYARLCECAEHAVQSGFSAIVDATFLDQSARELFRGLAARLNLRCVIVTCSADEATLRRRIEQRAANGDRTSDADIAVLEAQLRDHAPFGSTESSQVIVADTSEPQCVERIVQTVRSRMALG